MIVSFENSQSEYKIILHDQDKFYVSIYSTAALIWNLSILYPTDLLDAIAVRVLIKILKILFC